MYPPSDIIADALPRHRRRLVLIYRYLRLHLSEPVLLADVAAVIGLEPSYASRFIHQATGMRFTELRRVVRVDAAKALLLKTGLGMTEISQRVGFGDSTTFGKSFKRIVGVPPSKYRYQQTRFHDRSQNASFDEKITRSAETIPDVIRYAGR